MRFCEASDILHCLREFNEAAMADGIEDNDGDGNAFVNCQTYQAYSACLRNYLKVLSLYTMSALAHMIWLSLFFLFLIHFL